MTDSNYEENGSDEGRVLKTDVLGRVQTPAQQREAILDAFEQSGLSGRQFAKQHGINYQTFATWRQKRKRARGEYPEPEPRDDENEGFRFLEIIPNGPSPTPEDVASAVPSTGIVIEIGAGIQVRVEHETQLPLAIELIKSVSSSSGLHSKRF